MKMVKAVIRTEKLKDVKNALAKVGVVGMTICEVQGRGRQKGISRQWRGTEYVVDLLPKIQLELVIADEDLEKVISTIETYARTGKIGDGKIFILPVEEVVRVRTGDRGEEAI